MNKDDLRYWDTHCPCCGQRKPEVYNVVTDVGAKLIEQDALELGMNVKVSTTRKELLTGERTFDEWYEWFIRMFSRESNDAEKTAIRLLGIEVKRQELSKIRRRVEGAGLTPQEIKDLIIFTPIIAGYENFTIAQAAAQAQLQAVREGVM